MHEFLVHKFYCSCCKDFFADGLHLSTCTSLNEVVAQLLKINSLTAGKPVDTGRTTFSETVSPFVPGQVMPRPQALSSLLGNPGNGRSVPAIRPYTWL